MGKKLMYILIIIALIIAGIYTAKKISEGEKVTQTGANTVNNTNKTDEQNEVEENNTVEPETNNVENENTTTELSPEEQAKQIVKENWGEDDSVYFSYDGIKDGKYVVSVRDQSTYALYWYYVDLETGTFEIK